MGTPTSSLFPKIYLQYLEHTKILYILVKYLDGYFKYVDEILIDHKNNVTNIHTVLTTFNNITPTMQFTMEDK
jgi:hypothetical protein